MIGKNIRKFRTRLMHRNLKGRIQPMTRKMLADELECSEQKIYYYEYNQRTPSIKVLIRLCEVLKVTPNELIDGAKLAPGKYFDVKSIPEPENLIESFLESKKE